MLNIKGSAMGIWKFKEGYRRRRELESASHRSIFMASVKCPPSASCRVPPRDIRAIPARTVREFIGTADRAMQQRRLSLK